jgi:DNA polymerase II large subunit
MLNKQTEKYFKDFEKGINEIYFLAEEAKKKGLDPVDKVEIPLALTMAAKVVGLISTVYPQLEGSGVTERILELEREYGKLDPTVVFTIAGEVAKQKFCKFETTLEAIDAGVRVGFAYTTLGVVSSPIEGFTELKVGKRKDGKEYLIAYFSGPIRSAGTTASCIVLMLVDYLREMFGYDKYDPSEDEVQRYVTENNDYHDRITNLQYMPTEEEILFLARNIPIQIAGEPTDKLEVSNYKNLERVETNKVRGGMCLIFSEGLAQKAAKGFRLLNKAKKDGIKSTGFDFLKEYIELHEKRNTGKSESGPPTYIKDLVAGRPVYGHPGRKGGFRFRYGRGRVSGFSAAALHPATMAITDDFIASGTQLKIEKPTKGCIVMSCDKIDGPIVKLFNGSVRKPKSVEESRKLYSDVEEIIYLGDILFPFSDVLNRNADLPRPGYVEEWWELELKEVTGESKKGEDYLEVSFKEAVQISKKHSIPLHPKFIFYWTGLSKEQFEGLIGWVSHGRWSDKLVLPYNKEEAEKFEIGKRALELLGVEHEVTIENVVLKGEESKALLFNLGLNYEDFGEGEFLKDVFVGKFDFSKDVLENVNTVCELEIKDKGGTFIGARMGRPEKAKIRKLTGSPNVLFPVGREGGRLRSIQAACEKGHVKGDFPLKFCEKCEKDTIYPICEVCGEKTKTMYYFYELGRKDFKKELDGAERKGESHSRRNLELPYYFDKAVEHLGLNRSELPVLIKGVRGMSSDGKETENLAKGILRAMYGLQVNKDGTIRFDATEMPLNCFKPLEIGVGIEKLKELGYLEDVDGKELVSDDQILQLMPHDVLLPSSPETPDERADDVFLKVSQFVDDELEKFYKMKPFYNCRKKEDLIGQLGVCMAPHNCAGVVCRFIGFSNTLGLMASPYMHAAIRRDCDGDEAALMLLGDVLLNFSRKFLPGHRGGTQDAPLVLNAKIDAGEVDDQILDYEFVPEKSYPLELYQKAEQGLHSSEVKEVTICKDILKEGKDPFVGMGYTHSTTNFNYGVICSAYKLLETMQDKVRHQMELVERLRSVDTSDVARLIIDRHFIRDMKGNLRKFSHQGFRCVECNEIMRRPPLSGVCVKCGGKIIFTIHEGGIKKYLQPALDLAEKYDLSHYMKQNLMLIKAAIDSIFGKELEKQTGINEWVK